MKQKFLKFVKAQGALSWIALVVAIVTLVVRCMN